MTTSRQAIVLAALAAERGARFAPVQLQKLFFLLDENIAAAMGGRQFAFAPYDYGPFDAEVYHELERLERDGLAQITPTGTTAARRLYSLTPDGQRLGEEALQQLRPATAEYIRNASKWVRSLSFAELVGSIYKKYPHMRENSVFRG